jgi:dolichol-phosphate mannosyltransferase
MTRLAIDSLTSFTAMPLRMATWAGTVGSIASICAIGIAIGAQIVGATVPGWTSVFVAVFFLGAIQLLCLGLLGEYVGRLYAEAQHRPLYFIGTDTADSEVPPAVDGPSESTDSPKSPGGDEIRGIRS